MRKITDQEISFFDINGYVICKDVLHDEEFEHFRSESARLIDEILAGGAASPDAFVRSVSAFSAASSRIVSPLLWRSCA